MMKDTYGINMSPFQGFLFLMDLLIRWIKIHRYYILSFQDISFEILYLCSDEVLVSKIPKE